MCSVHVGPLCLSDVCLLVYILPALRAQETTEQSYQSLLADRYREERAKADVCLCAPERQTERERQRERALGSESAAVSQTRRKRLFNTTLCVEISTQGIFYSLSTVSVEGSREERVLLFQRMNSFCIKGNISCVALHHLFDGGGRTTLARQFMAFIHAISEQHRTGQHRSLLFSHFLHLTAHRCLNKHAESEGEIKRQTERVQRALKTLI